MILRKNLIVALAAASLMFSTMACSKSAKTNSATGDAQTEQSEQAENSVSLLSFVPENSPFVISSAQKIDMGHPVIQAILKQSEKYLSASEKFMERVAAPALSNDELKQQAASAAPDKRYDLLSKYVRYNADEESSKEINKTLELVKQMKELTKDYKSKAPEFGLNPEFNDSIIYLDDTVFVAKQSVADGAKLKAKLDDFLHHMPLMMELKYKEVKAGDETWSVIYKASESQVHLDMLKRKYDSLIKELEKDKEQDNDLYLMKKEFADSFNSQITAYNAEIQSDGNHDESTSKPMTAIHFGKNVVTVLFLTDESKLASYNRVLKPASKAMRSDALGSVQQNTLALGFLDTVKGFEKLMNSELKETVENILLGKMDNICIDEFKNIISDYPKVSFNIKADGSSKLTADSVLNFKDKESLKKIQSLHSGSLDLASDKTLFSFKFNASLKALFDQLMSHLEALSKKEYTCGVLSNISSASKDMFEFAASPDFEKIKHIISGISGINIMLDEILIQKGDIVEFEGAANLTGPHYADIAPDIIPMLGMLNRSFERKLKSISEKSNIEVGGEPSKIYLDQWELNAMLTQTDLIAATPRYNIHEMAAKDRADRHRFLEINFSYIFYSDILYNYFIKENPDSPTTKNKMQFRKDLKEGFKDVNCTISFGTNDEGFVSTNEIVF